MNAYPISLASVSRDGAVSRRLFLKTVAAASAAGLGMQDRLALAADELRSHGKAMIVLWMQGGPTQFETLDLKSHSQCKPIATAIPGIEIAEHFPRTAKLMNHFCVVRSMTNKEGNHARASYQLHTGYLPLGGVKHPGLGALIAKEIGPATSELPSFVSVNGPSQGSGFLPVTYAPFQVADPARMPENTSLPVTEARYSRRLKLLSKLERGYFERVAPASVQDHQKLIEQAASLVRSQKLEAFDIAKEPDKIRSAYGDSEFGQGCLLARRLIEAGVTFVEVQLGNWDTHFDNANRVANLAGQCDPGMEALVDDLKQRGMLDSTLVVWMGEFGRTPKVNVRDGRDHFPRAFSMMMAGGGIPGGQVIGKTDATGSVVDDRPVSVPDLLTTFCRRLGIDPTKENIGPLNRPLKIVDGGTPIV
ncbi:DUF1501 domain-containing protein [bacterium]|nr:DUF1501 domain-containing protein [bacterium]